MISDICVRVAIRNPVAILESLTIFRLPEHGSDSPATMISRCAPSNQFNIFQVLQLPIPIRPLLTLESTA